MHLIKPIPSITQSQLEAIIPGYSSSSVLRIHSTAGETEASFSLVLETLNRPFVKKHEYSDPATLAHYNDIASQGCSYGAFADENLVGFIIGEIQRWNSTLVIREFGVSPVHRKQGIGTALLEAELIRAEQEGLR